MSEIIAVLDVSEHKDPMPSIEFLVDQLSRHFNTRVPSHEDRLAAAARAAVDEGRPTIFDYDHEIVLLPQTEEDMMLAMRRHRLLASS